MAAVDRTIDPRYRKIAFLVHRSFNHRGNISDKAAMNGNAERPWRGGSLRPHPDFSAANSTTLRRRPVSIG